MFKKGIKGLVLVVLLLTLFGCSSEKVKIVNNNASEAGPGPLTKENVSLAGIHIGDSQEQVLKLYGEPTKKDKFPTTPFVRWYYEDLGLSVAFYGRGENEPVIGGVVDIQISAPSKLTTDTGIGLGDSLEYITKKYDVVYSFQPNGKYQSVFINGANKEEINGLYYPHLDFSLENNKITRIILTNQQQRP